MIAPRSPRRPELASYVILDDVQGAPHRHSTVVRMLPAKRQLEHLLLDYPYQDPQQEAERLKAVHEARAKIVPRI
jgi:hypothetical protein